MKGKIFNAQEVQAIISGNKTQFREVIKPQPNEQQKHIHQRIFSKNKEEIGNVFLSNHSFADFNSRKVAEKRIKCPYQVGQKIFCKERLYNFGGQFVYGDEEETILDKKDEKFWKRNCSKRVIPAKNCPESASRLTLQIKEIRVEPLQDISEEDCWKEGLEEFADYQDQVKICEMAKRLGECIEDPKPTFAVWWNATHKKPEEKFEANPWVWCVSFEVINN
jgi:hypothetical protein